MLSWTLPLRPPLITFYRGLLTPRRGRRLISRDSIAVISALTVGFILYSIYEELFVQLRGQEINQLALTKFLDLTLLALFVMITMSSVVVAIGQLFSALDNQIFVASPLPVHSFFIARITQIATQSGWLYLIFSIPLIAGLADAFNLGAAAAALFLIIVIALLIVAVSFGTLIAIAFSNILPPHRLRDVILIGAICLSAMVLIRPPSNPELPFSPAPRSAQSLTNDLRNLHLDLPSWFPSHIAALAIGDVSLGTGKTALYATSTLLIITISCFFTSLLAFDLLFLRGASMAHAGQKGKNIRSGVLSDLFFRAIFPFNQQLRALARKEAKMFLRDTAQAIQLMLLLVLTAVYIRNLGAMQKLSLSSPGEAHWWQIILGTANVTFGCCILSAIATRFVFPSVSLEGQAIVPLKASPLTTTQLLNAKALIWYVPVALLSCTLFVSGSLAISEQGSFVIISGILGAIMSLGIVRLAVGFGAIYSNFDWDSPTQITASIGSIMFVIAAVGLTAANTLPAFFLFALFGIPGLEHSMGSFDFWMCVICSLTLITAANVWAGNRAIRSGVASI